jgi:ferrous-iron efflux pump FieF
MTLDAAGRARVTNRAEATAVTVAALLAIAKGTVFALTGSVSVLASCADSLFDLGASTLNWIAVRKAAEPPDADHPWGHGKFEAIAGIFQAGFVAAAALYLLVVAIKRFALPDHLDRLDLGIAVMAASTVGSVVVMLVLRAGASRTGSLALAGDALHYSTDVLTNLATIAALLLTRQTGLTFWDPLICLLITGYLLIAATGIFRQAWHVLVDRELEPDRRQLIERALQTGAPPEVLGYYLLRTRSSSHRQFADLRLVVAAETPLRRVHDITETLERAVREALAGTEVVIHPEPEGAHDRPTERLDWQRPPP